LLVIPANAGIHFDLDFRFTMERTKINCKMDPGLTSLRLL